MTNGQAILATLEAVVERHGDPADAIYAELFANRPELEALFWLDRDGGLRASMVQQGLECILDHVAGGPIARQVIAAARQHHGGYGVPPERFDDFFVAMRDAFRRIMGQDWTPPMERAWRTMLEDFATIR